MTSPTIAAVVARRAVIQRNAMRMLAMTLLAVAGCSNGGTDGTTAPKKDPVAGTYSLRTIDATRPPVEVYHGPWFDSANRRFYNQMVMLITDGRITLDAPDRWSLTLAAQLTLDGAPSQQQIAASGSYTVDGDQVTLTMDGADGSLAATLRNGTISLTTDMNGNKRFKAYAFAR